MTTSRRALLGAIGLGPLASLAYGASFERRGATPADAADAFLRARMEAKGIPGAGLAVSRGGAPDKVAAYGLASIEFGIAATARTVFPIASASKMLAGFAAGKLAEMGRLDLDASARTYLPELPEALAGVRIHHLLSHTSGLRGPGANPDFAAQQREREDREAYVGPLRLDVFTDEEILRFGAAAAPAEAPGARWRYNQFPYFLFGLIVARLSGRSYAEFVAEALLRPLGIIDARYGDHRTLVPGRNSTNYTRQFGPLQNYGLKYTPGYWPAAGLNMSAAEAAKLLGAFRPGRLLREETLHRLWRRARLNDGSEADYGLGFTVTASNGRTWIGHEGGGCCYFGWWPDQQLGLAILLNLSGSHEDGIEAALAGLLLS
jgi:CubicO group peptidase (beta-lactamase class C family)